MDNYRQLAEGLRAAMGGRTVHLYQGIVRAVDGCLCEVEVDGLAVPGVRLRASETDDGGQLLVVPKVGSAVIVGSLSGDLAELAVLAIDKAESITLTATTVTLNGGKLGGLVKVAELTQKLNELVQAFNGHTHTGTHGPTSPPVSQAKAFSKDDYEDTTVKH